MANAARYFDLVGEMKNAYHQRLRFIESVKPRGIKPTARLFTTPCPPCVHGRAAIRSTALPACSLAPAPGISSLRKLLRPRRPNWGNFL